MNIIIPPGLENINQLNICIYIDQKFVWWKTKSVKISYKVILSYKVNYIQLLLLIYDRIFLHNSIPILWCIIFVERWFVHINFISHLDWWEFCFKVLRGCCIISTPFLVSRVFHYQFLNMEVISSKTYYPLKCQNTNVILFTH